MKGKNTTRKLQSWIGIEEFLLKKIIDPGWVDKFY